LVNTGPGRKDEIADPRVVHERAGDVARHEVGRELHPLGLDGQRRSQRPHEQRLRDAGHAFEQHVAAGQQADEQPGDGSVLTDDGLGHFGAHARPGAGRDEIDGLPVVDVATRGRLGVAILRLRAAQPLTGVHVGGVARADQRVL
jgi:hypothetical protein